MQYPLLKNYKKINKKEIKNLANESQKKLNIFLFKPKWVKSHVYKFENKYYFINEDWENNEELNKTTDYFTQYERIKCSFGKEMSPYDYFIANYKIITKKFNFDNLKIDKFEDYMFSNIKFCNNFRISICLKILNIFKPKKWLDISSGWGDRLISALLYGVDEYFGCDPNEKLQIGYNDINNFFNSKNKTKVTINSCGFENVNIPHSNYDLVLTSPPFFDLEIYSKFKDDSIISNKTMEEWYKNFLLVSIYKAASHLNKNGHLILYIDFADKSYIKRMIDDVNKIMKFMGCIYYYSNNKRLRPFYCWKF